MTALLLLSSSVHAATMIFNINANGAKEVTLGGVPNQGDPNGFAIGTLTLDNGTGLGTTGSATFNLIIGNLDPLSAHHIHTGIATTTGSPLIDFGNPNSILTGTATSGTLSGIISNLSATSITSILANPSGFYYNLHTSGFGGGAVRDQVPEPGTASLLCIGIAGFLARRRR